VTSALPIESGCLFHDESDSSQVGNVGCRDGEGDEGLTPICHHFAALGNTRILVVRFRGLQNGSLVLKIR
jgi:hypothetical protein